jgi:hypothetical protein
VKSVQNLVSFARISQTSALNAKLAFNIKAVVLRPALLVTLKFQVSVNLNALLSAQQKN